jgi:thiol-disulfide isomerase/thioredoxin
MEHIVGINELNSLELKREVKEFCEDHLVDLLEGDYKLYVSYHKVEDHSTNTFADTVIGRAFGKDLLAVSFLREDSKIFSWDDVCDKYIPVFELLSRKYNVVKVNVVKTTRNTNSIHNQYRDTKSYTKNLLNVVKSDLGYIYGITLYIKEDKGKKKPMQHIDTWRFEK